MRRVRDMSESELTAAIKSALDPDRNSWRAIDYLVPALAGGAIAAALVGAVALAVVML